MKSLLAIFVVSLTVCRSVAQEGNGRGCRGNRCLDPSGDCATRHECSVDPCLVNSCTNAVSCTANYCGGCHAIFTDEHGEVIDPAQCEPVTTEPQCPVTQPNPGDMCDFQDTCCYGEETCCGLTHDSFCCSCFDGKTACYYTDMCLGASCPGEECCDPALEPGASGNPVCMNGHVCCPDGSWSCGDADGSFSCGDARGEVCLPAPMAQSGGLEREILDYLDININGKMKHSTVFNVAVAIAIVSVVLVLASCACYCCCLRRNMKKSLHGSLYDKVSDIEEIGGEKDEAEL